MNEEVIVYRRGPETSYRPPPPPLPYDEALARGYGPMIPLSHEVRLARARYCNDRFGLGVEYSTDPGRAMVRGIMSARRVKPPHRTFYDADQRAADAEQVRRFESRYSDEMRVSNERDYIQRVGDALWDRRDHLAGKAGWQHPCFKGGDKETRERAAAEANDVLDYWEQAGYGTWICVEPRKMVRWPPDCLPC